MKYALGLSLILWGLIYTVVDAWGDYLLPISPIKLNAVGIIGNGSVTSLTHARMMRGAKAYYRNYGIVLKIGKLYKVADPYPYYREECNDTFCIADEFTSHYYKYDYLRRGYELLHVIAPPIVVDGERYFGGQAWECSIHEGGFSYSNAEYNNTAGAKRYRHSLNAMIHEIGHALGADHDNTGPNVMHENASQYVTGRVLPLNKKAIGEILRCTR